LFLLYESVIRDKISFPTLIGLQVPVIRDKLSFPTLNGLQIQRAIKEQFYSNHGQFEQEMREVKNTIARMEKKFEEGEKRLSFNTERYEKLEEKKKEAYAEIVHDQAVMKEKIWKFEEDAQKRKEKMESHQAVTREKHRQLAESVQKGGGKGRNPSGNDEEGTSVGKKPKKFSEKRGNRSGK